MKKFAIAGMITLALALSACGKKGAPHAPGPSQDIIYPGTYPPE